MSHAVIHADALTYLRGNRWLVAFIAAELAALRAMPPRCQPEWQPVGDWLEDEAS